MVAFPTELPFKHLLTSSTSQILKALEAILNHNQDKLSYRVNHKMSRKIVAES